ncbi:hypothetical protein FSP39_012906 [Pinctada imbricata]|uniref:VWFA domain-containing protein n=1 Tax=Pinctada imbricata TaxID=66713 RepID=A0AA89BVT6_PINIB|nr:hypothetical protein FSP39_012906 [Pinctada imbricata]
MLSPEESDRNSERTCGRGPVFSKEVWTWSVRESRLHSRSEFFCIVPSQSSFRAIYPSRGGSSNARLPSRGGNLGPLPFRVGNRGRGECSDQPVDLIFLLDSSWSLRNEENFQKELKFVSEVVTVLNWDRARVSVITFSDSAAVKIKFGTHGSLRSFQSAVQKIPWVGGNTYTDQALELMLSEINLNRAVRAGSGVVTMGVVITDGGSTDPFKTKDVISRVHSTGVEMFAIGVGQSINEEELKMIATDPDRDHYYTTDDLDGLQRVKDMIAPFFCVCRGKPVDIVFVLDSSWSLGSTENFQKELKFVSDVVRNLEFNFGESTVSIITFSDNAEMRLRSQSFSRRDDFQREILNLDWKGGNTYTNKALEMMYDEMRNKRSGTVGVVVTDGGSTDPAALEAVVRKIHRIGFQMFAIGVGKAINRKELEMIASEEKSAHLFMVDDLDGLRALESMVTSSICPNCRGEPLDLMFILDSSWSLRSLENFQKELSFVTEVVNSLAFNFGDSRVSVITFSDDAEMRIQFGAVTRKDDFQREVNRIDWKGGNTYTNKALEMMYNAMNDGRRNRLKIAVVITDGGSTDPFSLEQIVKKIHSDGSIQIFAIGVGKSINIKELEMIASNAVSDHLFMVNDVDGLAMLDSMVSAKICPICVQDPADVIFIIDKSSSLMTEINLQKELSFVMSVIETLDIGIGSRQTRVGVISFSTDAMLEVGLGKYSSKSELERDLLYVEFSRGDTYTHKAIDIMLDEFANARRNVKRIGVVITDGGSTDPYSLKDRLVKVRSQRITMFAIGVGDAVNPEELSDIGSDPDETYVSHVDNLDALGKLNLELGLKRCSPA